jgi:hypothetical protein
METGTWAAFLVSLPEEMARAIMAMQIEKYRTGQALCIIIRSADIGPDDWKALMAAVSDAPITSLCADVYLVDCTLVDLPQSCFVDLLKCAEKKQRQLALHLEFLTAEHTVANDLPGGPATIFAQLKCLFDHLRDHDNGHLVGFGVHSMQIPLEALLRIARPVFAHRIPCTDMRLYGLHDTTALHAAFRPILDAVARHPTMRTLRIEGCRFAAEDPEELMQDVIRMEDMACAIDLLGTRIWIGGRETGVGSTLFPHVNKISPDTKTCRYWGSARDIPQGRRYDIIDGMYWDGNFLKPVPASCDASLTPTTAVAVDVGELDGDMEQTCEMIARTYPAARAIVIGTERSSVHDTWYSRHADTS